MIDYNRWVGDIEVYPNYFCAAFENYDTGEKRFFQINEYVDDSKKLISFLKTIKYLIGFNSKHYDDLHFVSIIKGKSTNVDLYNLTQKIINTKSFGNYSHVKEFKYFPRGWNIIQIDLFLYWSMMLRVSKMLSLKSLACQMNYPNIQEIPIPPGTYISKEQFPIIGNYVWNDVAITKLLVKELSDEINFRIKIQKKYNVNAISKDTINIGSDIFLKLYCEKTNQDVTNIKQLRTHRDNLDLSKIVFDNIAFNDIAVGRYNYQGKTIKCETFSDLHNHILQQKVTSTNELNYTIIKNGVKYDYGSGGIHAFGSNKIYTSNDDYRIIDADIQSFYPAIICEYGLYPNHLGLEWTKLYNQIRHERIEAKTYDKLKANVFKLLLNGSYGLFNNEYSWLYDPKVTLAVTVNGQLMISMLIQRLLDVGIEVYTANTDGITCYVHRDQIDDYYEICKQWQLDTKMILEYEQYDKTIMLNVNNYLWINKKGVKQKGLFKTNPELGNSNDNLVIPKALEAYYVHGIQPEDFITNHKNIYDFCASPKVAKSYTVTWLGIKQQNLNRFYVSKKGAYLYKQKEGGNLENLMKGNAVQLFNTYEEQENYNIDYSWYITKTKKIIEELEPQQMDFFQ